jgi:uncharacterized integral membrane protein
MENEKAEDARLGQWRQNAAAWISSADAKAMGVITVGGALLAILAAVVAAASAWPQSGELPAFIGKREWALFLVFCGFCVVAIGLSAWVLYPRTDRAVILRKAKWKNPLPVSRSYFADLASMSKDKFLELARSPTTDEDQRDVEEQTFVLQWIARRKMGAITVSIGALTVSLFALALMLVLAIVRVF